MNPFEDQKKYARINTAMWDNHAELRKLFSKMLTTLTLFNGAMIILLNLWNWNIGVFLVSGFTLLMTVPALISYRKWKKENGSYS